MDNKLMWKMTKTANGNPVFCVNSSYELTANAQGGTDVLRHMYNYKKFSQGGPDFSKMLPGGALTENDNIVRLCNMNLLSLSRFSTSKDCETTKAFLLDGENWCKILPTAPPGCIIKNSNDSGWEMYENESDTHTFFVNSEKQVNGMKMMWKMTKTSPNGPVFSVNSSYELTANEQGGTDVLRHMYNY